MQDEQTFLLHISKQIQELSTRVHQLNLDLIVQKMLKK